MKIAIIGSGIAGLTAAYRLHKTHEIIVFEANSYIGGHTNTIDVEAEGRNFAVDTGFIVFNDWTYPNFISHFTENPILLGCDGTSNSSSNAMKLG